MKWKAGVKERIFLAFFLYTILIFGFAFAIFNLFKRVENFDKAYEASSRLHRATLEAIKNGHEFFLYELASERFWTSRQSRILDNQQQMILQINLQSHKLSASSWGASSPRLQKLLTNLIESVNDYDTTYKQMVLMTMQRGFKDHGLVGRFRNTAHKLQSMPKIDMIALLQIRRNEKDYMLRSDWKYAESVFDLGHAYQEHILSDSRLGQAEKDTMNRLISNYLSGFDSLLRLDSKLGHLKLLGLHGRLKRIGNQMTVSVTEIEAATNIEKKRVFTFVKIASVAIITVSVILMLILLVSFQFIFGKANHKTTL